MARIHFRPGHPGALPSAWLIRPATPGPANALVAVHGLNREAEAMAEALACRADATGRTLVLPVFDRAAWPRFQHAACPHRADWGLLALLRVLRAEGWIGAAPPDLSGFSGGAQFAHRFAWLYPEEVGRLCLVAPGWWTFPDARGAHPRGLAPGGGAEDAVATFRLTANLPRFLDREIDVRVGALDTEQDRNLRQDPDVVAQQGAHRVARARAWVAAARLAAEARGIAPRIAFHLMENCGHSFADCIAIGGLGPAFVPPPRPAPARSSDLQIVEVA